MIDNMPKQNSPFHSAEAKVLIPVWKTGERDKRKLLFLIRCHFASGQRGLTRCKKKQGGGGHETDIGKLILRQQVGRQKAEKKAKCEDMGKERENAGGWKKR